MDDSQLREIDGKQIAQDILRDVGVIAPVMQKRVAFIQFGTDAASVQFVARKQRVATGLGIQADTIHEKGACTTEGALAVLAEVVEQGYDGIVIQLPLPYTIDTDVLLNAIPVERDIDLLGAEAQALFERGQTERLPPVAGAVDAVFKSLPLDLTEKSIVIVGKGRLVGHPIALWLGRMNIPYEAIDRETPLLDQHTLLGTADIVISGVGSAGHIQPSMVKEGVILIDAGTSEHNGVLVGDVDPLCYDKATFYTPVPGGIGPITVAVLLRNLFL